MKIQIEHLHLYKMCCERVYAFAKRIPFDGSTRAGRWPAQDRWANKVIREFISPIFYQEKPYANDFPLILNQILGEIDIEFHKYVSDGFKEIFDPLNKELEEIFGVKVKQKNSMGRKKEFTKETTLLFYDEVLRELGERQVTKKEIEDKILEKYYSESMIDLGIPEYPSRTTVQRHIGHR